MPKADELCAPEQLAIHNPRKFLLANNTVANSYIFMRRIRELCMRNATEIFRIKNCGELFASSQCAFYQLTFFAKLFF